jgi:RNA polymerase sigma-70 factor, ECF subfamily
MLVDFHSLYERHAQDVYRFALYLSGNPSLAEDITQEAFVRAWVTPGKVHGGTAKAYLFAIVRNLNRAERKRRGRCVALDETLPDAKPGPEAVAGGRLERDAVLEALQTLPETDRAALLMHAQEGLPYVTIAAVLGLSVAAVKVKIHRARIKLKQLCDPIGGWAVNVTREVITDLWPVYASGEASADTRALVEAFLRQDPQFARLVQEGGVEQFLRCDSLRLPAHHEAQALRRTKQLLHGWDWLYLLAVLFSCFAFGRIVSDTSWDVSPRNFIITASIAGAFWVAFVVRTVWVRRWVYRGKV